MATLASLKRKAKASGIPASLIRKAASAAELTEIIAMHNGAPKKAVRKSTVKKATIRKAAVSKSAVKRTPAAKSTTGKAKRSATKKATSVYVPKGGRNLLGSVDFNKEGDWNPRKGSAPDRIIKALKKARGNRDSAFETLKADVWDFVGKVKRNGDKRTKDEAYAMLKYRIARTLWDFTLKTNQHKIATNRIEYGTGPNAQPKRKTARKVAAKPAAKRGRPKGTTAKPTTGKRRGRPPGSKNRPKAGK